MLRATLAVIYFSALAHSTSIGFTISPRAPQGFSFRPPDAKRPCSVEDGDPLQFRNDITTTSAPCKPITIIYARGTTEPGNVGNDVGPCFFSAMNELHPDAIAVQGVNNYKANIPDFLIGGSSSGATEIASNVNLARTKCPDTSIILSGLSQGAQITHNAAKEIAPDDWKSVKAVVLFGDPKEGDPFPSELDAERVVTICHKGDAICKGTPFILPPHLTYQDDAKSAAAKVEALLGGNFRNMKSRGD